MVRILRFEDDNGSDGVVPCEEILMVNNVIKTNLVNLK